MTAKISHNSINITGNISSISDIKKKSNGNDYMYINIAQNTKNGESSFYPLYLDGVILDKFNQLDLKIGDRINAVGKLDSFNKNSKNVMQIKPFELKKIEKKQVKQENQERSN